MNAPAWASVLTPRRLTTIRGRLLIGVLVLLAAGLVGNSIASAVTLRTYLHHRAEATLRESGDRVHRILEERPQTVDGDQLATLVEPLMGITVIGPSGKIAEQVGAGVPRAINGLTADRLDQVLTFDGTNSVPDLLALRIPTAGLTIATSHQSVKASAVILTMRTDIDRVTVADFISGQATSVGITLVLAFAVALLILRIGLRPLGRMADAADDIASGARSERLPVHGSHTETDRLAVAVNDAFDAQARAETQIRDFAADASHELRTPLATISGWLDLYNQGGLSAPAALDRALERVDGEVGRMRLLVEELSLLARLDAGRPLDSQPVDLRSLATAVVQDAQVVAPDRAINLYAPEPARVQGDQPRLQQVLNNLLGNAIQHTSPGTTISVAVEPTPTHVTIQVADHGPGIPPGDLTRVFDRFWRADAGRSRAHGGSGLGLPIVQAIVHAHHGTVHIASVPGTGTTVTVTLPVQGEHVAPATPPTEDQADTP
ncbi:HAMP domain-containing sensor histidine kinase [Streptomyces sp. NPDC052179]|uniref:sensor histidine kinase n=1 Tax=Streptomyces sp. NPDC052179 TaxID=3155680 RepID=UPI003431CF9B